MSNIKDGKYTFWELIDKVGIKIPIIQRDYAQGRNTNRVQTIRENFLNTIFEVLKDDGKTIDLDFVYGTIKNGYLIPLDGQQRLTTLFLLHYYLALYDNNNRLDDEIKEKLKRFTYETRLSSREFIELLIDNEVSKTDIKCNIENQTWFFSEWENDPTIKSMLIMLDAIEKKFKNTEGFFEKLMNQRLITFSFLNLDDFKLTDELYVKMNARGKPLSDFENFKSKFEVFIEAVEDKAKLDNKWYDIFWKIAIEQVNNSKVIDENSKYTEVSDKLFLNFFKNITAFNSDDFNEVDIFKFRYDFPSIARWKLKPDNFNIFIKPKLPVDEIVKILDALIAYKDNEIYSLRNYHDFKINIFQAFLKNSNDKEFIYEVRLRFYALIKFFIKIGNVKGNESLFKQWMRICLNIINNASPYAIKDDYKSLQKLLDDLSLLLKNDSFYNSLSEYSIEDYEKKYREQHKKPKYTLPKYIKEQLEEEKLKAALISQDKNWKNELIKAENHWYLDGQIKFLIDYAENDLKKFKEYRDTFIVLWNFTTEKENKKNEQLIQRSLLTFGDYLPKHNNTDKYTFCTFGKGLREKTENWRIVFRSDYFKQLLDEIKTIDSLSRKLINIINNYKFNCTDWKSYFINPNKDWSVLDQTRNYQIRWKDEFNIYLNRGDTKSTSWGWSRVSELRSYYLYRILKYEKTLNITPFQNNNNLPWYYVSTEEPCCVISNWNIENYQFEIDISFTQQCYCIEFYDRNDRNLEQIDEKLKQVLQQNDFVFNEENNIYKNSKHALCKENVIEFLNNLLQKFQSI